MWKAGQMQGQRVVRPLSWLLPKRERCPRQKLQRVLTKGLLNHGGWRAGMGAASSQLSHTGKGAATVRQVPITVGSAAPSGLLLTLSREFTVMSVSLRAPTNRGENVDSNCIFGVGNGSHWSTSHGEESKPGETQEGKEAWRKTEKENNFIMVKKRESRLSNKWKGRWEECLCKISEIPKWFHGCLCPCLSWTERGTGLCGNNPG